MTMQLMFARTETTLRRWPPAIGWAAVFSVVALVCCAQPALAQGPIYVTPGGGGTGSSWASPTTLQNALATATSGTEIWVATGVYTPGLTADDTFTVNNGLQLYGGFAATETLRTERDWAANPTILSGDLGGDDSTVGGVVIATADLVGTNAYHVLWLDGTTGAPVTTTTRIDGFTVTAGQANGSNPHFNGGGLYCDGSGSGSECSPALANLTFSGNAATYAGGAMYNNSRNSGVSSPSLVNVTFSGNHADNRGGAMHNGGAFNGVSSPSLVNVTFSGNQADDSGGAMYNDGYSDGASHPSLVNVTFSGNQASSGGAIYNDGHSGGASSPRLVNVTFSGNSATNSGGAMYNFGNGGASSPDLVNVTFSSNSANDGGAMYNDGANSGVSSPSLANVILWGNTANGVGDQLTNNNATPVISYTLTPSTTADIFNGYDDAGVITWGPGNLTQLSAFATKDIFVDAANGDLRLTYFSPAIDAGDNTPINASGVSTDLGGNARLYDDLGVPDRGSGSPPVVDMGAYERQSMSVCPPLGAIHVNHAAGGSGDGSTWPNAHTRLQDALAFANAVPSTCMPLEIWVATGVYTPGLTAGDSFTVTSGIRLYGGFAATETLRTERNWVANPTVLSGDIGGDDSTDANGVVTATANITGTNAEHVLWLDGVNGVPITATTRIEGFTITAGSANFAGGGFYCVTADSSDECSPTVANVTFSGNSATSSGGAMYNDGQAGPSSPSLVNVTFSGNSAGYGGAMYNNERSYSVGSPSLVNVTFSGNAADYYGGAMYNDGTSGGVNKPSLINVTFSSNQAQYGGAMYNYSDVGGVASPSLVNVTFSGNQAQSGGAIYNESWYDGAAASPSLVNVTFSDNAATDSGGAMYNYSDEGGISSPSLANVILWGNTAITGAQLYNLNATPVISYTLIPSSTADIYDDASVITWGPGNLTDGRNPLLGALGDYGGPSTSSGQATWTVPLLPGSPAIDAGDAGACPAADQRGVARPQGAACDIGAFERRSFSLSKGAGDGQSASVGITFGAPISVTVSSAYTEPLDGGQVTFAGPLSGAGATPVTTTVTITGGAAAFTPTANATPGSYNVIAGAAGASQVVTFTLTNNLRVGARNDAAGTLEGAPVTIAVLANDQDPAGQGLTVITVTQGANGAVAIAAGGQTVVYTPTGVFTGTDSFHYGVQDGNGATDDAFVTVVVAAQTQAGSPAQVAAADSTISQTVAFSSTQAGVTVVLPAGFYSGTVEGKDIFFLAFTPAVTTTRGGPPNGFMFGDYFFTLNAYLNDTLISPITFATPVTITFVYSSTQFTGLQESSLQLRYWDAAGSVWSTDGIACDPPDTTAHTLTCVVTHLTEFGVLGNASPTAATLADFGAVATADAVTVLWTTADESNLAGFHLYRGAAADDPGVRLNAALIAAQGAGGLGGFSYSYVDAVATPPGAAWFYWLETVDFGGGATRHGPILAAAVAPRLYLPAVMAGADSAALERAPDSGAPFVTPAAQRSAPLEDVLEEVQAEPPGAAPDEAGAAATLHLPLITR